MASALNIIIHLKRTASGERFVEEIREITGIEGDALLYHRLALREKGNLIKNQIPSLYMEKLIEKGQLPKDFFNTQGQLKPVA